MTSLVCFGGQGEPGARPFAEGQLGGKTETAGNEGQGKKKRLAAAEDNAADVFLLRNALFECGAEFEITVFEDGEQAVRYLEGGETPDLVLLDLNLPRIDGVALLEVVSRQERLQSTPVLIWSSGLSREQVSQLGRYRVTEYIEKPASLEGYRNVAKRIVELTGGLG